MTSAVNIQATSNASLTNTVNASAAAHATSASSSNASYTTKSLVQPPDPGVSPRLVSDPSAGVIIQYLNSDGTVQSQIPSTAVVAYLRAGLTAQGLSRQPANGATDPNSAVASTTTV